MLEPATPRRQSLGFELILVVMLAFGTLAPGIWKYSLVDPWETHYGEVARMMLQNHDLVHMDWPGGDSPAGGEGFRSKPVLTFWMMSAGMTALDVGHDGGYSGEMVASVRTMIAIRLPFILSGVLGLTLVWLMLARLVSRRVAWLALLVVGSTPFFCLIARQGIPDMPLCSTVMGAIAMFTLAIEDGERPIGRAFGRVDHRQLVLGVCGAFVIAQALYYVAYFIHSPQLAVVRFPTPVLFFPLFMGLLLTGLWSGGWMLIPAIPGLRALVRGLLFPVAWTQGGGWPETAALADRVLVMAPIVTMRQVYMLWCYALLGLSVLAKGPPGLTVVGAVGFFHVVLFARWRDLWNGAFEIKRGLMLMTVIALPWHIAMWLKDGVRFIDEYLFTHILNRAGGDPDKSLGTFEYYTSQLGHGMWLWAALLPAAFAVALLKSRSDTREGRVRFMVALWAICGVAVFGLVQTKFHHYILPVVPALGIIVAFFLDDLWAKRERLHPLYAALGIGIVLLIARDLVWEPERWIEMFVFRYDRPWPAGEPYSVDTSDAFLVLGAFASVALALTAIWRRAGVIAISLTGFAICVWALQVYMPEAGTHWGMRDAMRSYYTHRTIYGEKRIYFGPGELVDDLEHAGDAWHFETLIPDGLQTGQPMTITIQLNKAGDEKITEQTLVLVGAATAIGAHDVTVTLAKGEREKLAPILADCKRRLAAPKPQDPKKAEPMYGRPPVFYVDADRLIAWQLYWRGENFWSGDEIFNWAPELRTGFGKPDNVEFLKYLNDRSKAPLGRRYFLVTEAGRAQQVKAILPTQRARDTFEVTETSSNKFSMTSFVL